MKCPMKVLTSWSPIVLLLLLVTGLQAQSVNDENTEMDPGDPWETPLQELQRINIACSMKISRFYETASLAHAKWQSCIDTIRPKFPELESRTSREEASKINASVIQEIDRRLHMAICHNTTAYKGCWAAIIRALNVCEPGAGDVAEKMYFALYDDVCREGGRITIENRRLAAAEGRLCERDYVTEECIKNKKEFRYAHDLCVRFESNVACDLSSIDGNCSNTVDKGLHADIFNRVRETLGCSNQFPFAESTEGMMMTGGAMFLHDARLPILFFSAVLAFGNYLV